MTGSDGTIPRRTVTGSLSETALPRTVRPAQGEFCAFPGGMKGESYGKYPGCRIDQGIVV